MKTIEKLIESITKAAAYKYPNDRMAPGVTIAWLKTQEFYTSIVRWCPDKKVVTKSRGSDLGDVLEDLATSLLELEVTEATNPIDVLRQTLKNKEDDDDVFPSYEDTGKKIAAKDKKNPIYPCPDPFAYDYSDDFFQVIMIPGT